MTAVKPPLDPRSEKLKVHTNEIVRRMFVATADGNYIVARLAFFHQLPFDFYWLSLHALEKYYKAILLMNGRPVLQYKHHLAPLHQAVLDLEPRLPISELVDPQIGHLRWVDETMDAWLARLDRFGAADNRYATYGYYLREDDLFKVDQHVWNVRRCCRLTDWLRLLRAGANDASVQNGAPDVVAWAVDHIRFSQKDERQLRGAMEDYTSARAKKMSAARRGAGA